MKREDEPVEASEWQWDYDVDVLCVGAGPGALAQAIYCADLGHDVQLVDVEFPSEPTDPDTAAYVQSMTDDLGPAIDRDLELAVVRAQPVTVSKDRRATIEPFFGSQLRVWSARCVASPFGVVYSQVPDTMTSMRAASGETIRVATVGEYRPESTCPAFELAEWLLERARDRDLLGESGTTLQRLVFEGGQVAGAELSTPRGTRLVRATMGVALSIGPMPERADWPVQSDLPDGAAQVVVVSRTASRFGRVELLYG